MLPELKAYDILEKYQGKNNQILFWQFKNAEGKLKLTRSQAEYVINYHLIEPKTARKKIKLESFYADKLKLERHLKTVPENIWVEKLLAESDKAYHIIGKLTDDSKLEFMWIPKCFIIREKPCNVVINYSKYDCRPPLSHQPDAIEKLVCNDKFILADDMGLCKTGSAVIASIEVKPKRSLIICPATLKINWKREIAMYTDKSVYIVEGKEWEENYDYYIINYDIIKNFHNAPIKKKGKKKVDENEEETVIVYTEEELMLMKRISEAEFDLIIIDEAHYISNPKAQRTQLVNDIASKTKRLWLLTGTPMTSRPINYYNLLKLIDAPIAYNWQVYVRRYCKGYQFKIKQNGKERKIWNVSGSSNLDELRERCRPYILRRLKTEVLDLPEKIITPIYLELKSLEYEKEMEEYLDWSEYEGKEASISVHISKLMKVRVLMAKEKVPYTIEIVERLLEQEKKVIVFTNFTETLDIIAKHFGKAAVTLDGRMTKAKRQHSVDLFQTDPKKTVFVANLKAGGVGLTLTEAEAVVKNDLSFVPAEHVQGEDRAFRYGQKNSVSIYYPLFENTMEMIMYDILARKKVIINTAMGDNEFDEEFGLSFLEKLTNS